MRLSTLCICFFRSLHLQQWVKLVRSRTFTVLRIHIFHLVVCRLMRLIAAPTLLWVPRLTLQEKLFGLMVPNIMVPKMEKGVLGLVDLSTVVLMCLEKVGPLVADGIFLARVKVKLAV